MTNTTKSYETATITKLDRSRVEIVGSIPATVWESYRTQALKDLNNSITLDGFRKGQIPENVLIAKVGNATLNQEMAEAALSKAYIDILIDNKIDAIGKPEVHITKLASGNPLEFKMTTDTVPEVKLPDYKKIAATEIKSAKPVDEKVSDKELDEAILRIRKQHASHEDHDHDKLSPEEHEKAIMDSLPEFNDQFVQGLGDFKDIADFKDKVREIIGENKKDEAKEKLRIKIADSIVKESTIDIPDIMVEAELNRTEAQFKNDLERMNVKLEDYLKHAKKSLEDIRKEWRPHAENKAKLQLVLNSIATTEKLNPSKEEIENEVNHIVAHYKDADRERASVYAETVLMNEKVFQFLEKA